MKILQLVTKRQFRGAEISAFDLSKNLMSMGHEIYWVGLYEHSGEALNLPGAHNADLPGSKKAPLNFAKVKALKNFIKEHNIDIIQANGSDNLKYAVAAQFVAKLIPIVYRNISMVSFWIKDAFIKKAFNRFLFSRVNQIVSIGEQSMEDLINFFPSVKNKIEVINQGIPDSQVDRFTASEKIKKEFGLQSNSRLLLWAGAFSFEKNPKFMMDVMNEVKIDFPDAKLIMAGKGPMLEEIKEEVKNRKLEENIIVAGYRSDLQTLYAASELFLLGSKIEGVPGVILEAAIQSTPTVAVSVGGVNEVVINNKTGIILKDHNVSTFADAIKYLLQMSLPELNWEQIPGNLLHRIIMKK
ncbi:MAG: glycosyltransferase [Ferruginibacter sp.]